MFINSHLATGYLLYKLNIFEKKWLPIWILSAWIPDIDGLWSSSVVEHHSVLHTQIFWIVLCSLGWFIGHLVNEELKNFLHILLQYQFQD